MAWADACCVCHVWTCLKHSEGRAQLTSKAQTTNTDIFWLLKNTQKDSEFFPSRCQCNLHILKHSSTFLLESPQTHPLQNKVPRLHYGTSVVLWNTPQYLNGTIIGHFKEQRGFQKHPIIFKCYILMVIPVVLYLGNTCTNTIRTWAALIFLS